MSIKKRFIFVFFLFILAQIKAEDGYDLWLRYVPVTDAKRLIEYQSLIKSIAFYGHSATIEAAKEELNRGLKGLLRKNIPLSKTGNIIIGTAQNVGLSETIVSQKSLKSIGNEGYIIGSKNANIYIIANTDIGVLYGTFHFLRLLQTNQSIHQLDILEKPLVKNRILNHWDNLNRHVERGYAGQSIWDWHRLPDYIDPRYKDYARANASIGINGVSPINVNANAQTMTPQYLIKIKALADVFRPYGIKMYLTARFSAPIEIGKLKTADPLDPSVQKWWKDKVDEIYQYIPDFGGFVVKANSEGQPGPQSYGRNHAEGANMLADALAAHGGIVMWRAFVYEASKEDRHKHGYNEFKPLDGQFRKNVMVQVKNGAIDFQPREPFHPLFGQMPQTPIIPEFQITHEYLGQATHLVYSGTLFKECLASDTYAKGKGSTVAKVMDGSLDGHELTGVAGVANIGSDRNWCGHPFLQSNWYAFGRLAWNHQLDADKIAAEWLFLTFHHSGEKPVSSQAFADNFMIPMRQILSNSRENMVNYMTPLGLHHIMGYGHHYGPAPWVDFGSRPDWNCTYYHKADSTGIGFDRTAKGSDALSQYHPSVSAAFSDIKTCPEAYVLWFHHLPWDHKMQSGRNLWDELCFKYYGGVESVRNTQKYWNNSSQYIDKQRFEEVKMLLTVQEKEAVWWRNACLLYFQTFSKKPITEGYEKPDKDLDYYKNLKFPYAPGN
ncbi:MAG: alpha-glucuronidase [Saprospiraceae bacterium]|nr:alpha-glucuronidase [Saprospiraceae bacterium]